MAGSPQNDNRIVLAHHTHDNFSVGLLEFRYHTVRSVFVLITRLLFHFWVGVLHG